MLIGVDASSTDRTAEIAYQLADIVYKCQRSAECHLARMLVFNYATGDWILFRDDDEETEMTFDRILPELMRDPNATHYHFPRKWIVTLDPCEYVTG